jgi:hypothetical protein
MHMLESGMFYEFRSIVISLGMTKRSLIANGCSPDEFALDLIQRYGRDNLLAYNAVMLLNELFGVSADVLSNVDSNNDYSRLLQGMDRL